MYKTIFFVNPNISTMDVTWILFSLFCYIHAVSGQIATSKVPGVAVAAEDVQSRTSVSASDPDCTQPLICPAVNCPFRVTPQGQCCPVCLPVIVKPGECPVPTGNGHCAEMCFRDQDCPGPMKCCSNGCGKDCMMPKNKGKDCVVDGKRYKDGETFMDQCNTCICDNGNVACTLMACTPEKLGDCPEPTTPGICILGCSSNWSCPDTQKCCSNGCGLVCTLPIGAISTQPHCDGVFCPEVYCDDQVIPPGKCCNECPATPTAF